MNKTLLILLCFIGTYSLYAQKNSIPYDFPIKSGSAKWNNFKSVDEMYQNCQIPPDSLSKLSTPSLLQTCINYPAKSILLLYNTPQRGFEVWKQKFNGISEYINRPDAALALITFFKDFDIKGHSQLKNDIDKGAYTFKLNLIEVIAAQEEIIEQMNLQEQKAMLKNLLAKYTELESDKIYGFSNLESTGRVIGKLLNKMADQSTKAKIITNEAKVFLQTGIIKNREVLTNIISEAKKININD